MPHAPGTDDAADAPAEDAPDAPAIRQESDRADADSDAGADIKSSYRDALARKTGRNSHAENHLIGRQVGGGNNETHKRTFRRKSG